MVYYIVSILQYIIYLLVIFSDAKLMKLLLHIISLVIVLKYYQNGLISFHELGLVGLKSQMVNK